MILMLFFFTIFFIKRLSLKWFNLYMKLLRSNTIFKQKNNHCIAYNSQFKKYTCNSTHGYNRKIWLDIPSYIPMVSRRTFFFLLNPLSANPTKWLNTLKQFVGNLPTNCLILFDHFVKLTLKGLKFWVLNMETVSIADTSLFLCCRGILD